MKKIIDYIENLRLNYRYGKLPKEISKESREIYVKYLPEHLKIEGDQIQLFSKSGTLIASGYNRIVVGDYGAFIEIEKSKMIKESLCAQKGEEYRYKSDEYRNKVKYFWYTTKDNSGCKIYFQQKRVPYADYKRGYFYISPYEININE